MWRDDEKKDVGQVERQSKMKPVTWRNKQKQRESRDQTAAMRKQAAQDLLSASTSLKITK